MTGRRFTYPTVALALLLLPGLLAAQGPHHRGPYQGGMKAGLLVEGLDLDEAQRQAIDELMASYRDELTAQFQVVAQARRALGDQIYAEIFDEAAIRAASTELAAAEAETAVTRGEIYQQLRGLLNAEQVAQLEKMREAREERFMERRQRRREHRPATEE